MREGFGDGDPGEGGCTSEETCGGCLVFALVGNEGSWDGDHSRIVRTGREVVATITRTTTADNRAGGRDPRWCTRLNHHHDDDL